MIGARAFLLELLPALVPLLMVLAIVTFLVRSRKRQHGASPGFKGAVKGVIVIVVLVLGVAIGGLRLVRESQYHSTLRNLDAGSVDSIRVGDTKLEDAAAVRAVIIALRDQRWYSPTAGDGGRAQVVDLVIHFRSGEELRYPVARHMRYKGAIVDFVSQDRQSNFVAHYGYAYDEELPEVLGHLGIQLPAQKKNGP